MEDHWAPAVVLPSGFQIVVGSLFAASVFSCVCSGLLGMLLLANREYLTRRCPQLLWPLVGQSVADFVWSVTAAVMFAPPTFGASFPTSIEMPGCTYIGALSDFAQTASCGYYTVVCLQALLVVKRYPDSVITMVNRYSHVVVLALSIFVPAIPLALGKYGPVGVAQLECWIVGPRDPLRALFYIVVVISLLFAIFVLLVVWRASMSKNLLGRALKVALKRMVAFVLVFLFIWLIPIINRLYPFVADGPAPFWLAATHLILLSLLGTVNCLVWVVSRPLQRIIRRRSSTESLDTDSFRRGLYDAPPSPGARRVYEDLGAASSDGGSGVSYFNSPSRAGLMRGKRQPDGRWAFPQHRAHGSDTSINRSGPISADGAARASYGSVTAGPSSAV